MTLLNQIQQGESKTLKLEWQKRNQSFDEEICREQPLAELDLTSLVARFAARGKPLDEQKLKNLKLIALREALVNALVHRDYVNQGQDIKVGVYDDVVNVVSPGGLPSTLTAETLLDGRSEIRNRVVARVFKELGYIEQWGSGIQRIRVACLDWGLAEPRIREKGDFVDVEFYRPGFEGARLLLRVSAKYRKVSVGYRKMSSGF